MQYKFSWLFSIPLVGIFISGCTGFPNVLNPRSMVSGNEAWLYWVVLVMAAVIFVIVEGGLVLIVIKHRQKKGEPGEPKQVFGNTTLEIIWTVIPVVLVVALFIISLRTMETIAAPPPSKSDVNVIVVGHRWWWEFDYPDLGIKTADELHMPVGSTVQVTLESVDVIHSFWVSQLTGKTDVIPGQPNHTWLVSNQIGIYAGQCSEFCGIEHANMRFNVIVESAADFQTWVANQQKPVAPPQTDLAQAGAKIVTQGICASCHTVDGTSAKGTVGPNLTHLFTRSIIAGGIAPLTDENLRGWLTDPGAMKPGNLMSSIHLNPQDIDKVLAYLHTLQ